MTALLARRSHFFNPPVRYNYAASPSFAAIILLVNNSRAPNNRHTVCSFPVSFLNPSRRLDPVFPDPSFSPLFARWGGAVYPSEQKRYNDAAGRSKGVKLAWRSVVQRSGPTIAGHCGSQAVAALLQNPPT